MPDTPEPMPLSTCIGCGQTDDHPKHIDERGGGIEVRWHMDCHVISLGSGGEPGHCDICTPRRVGADGLTGDTFRTHILTIGA